MKSWTALLADLVFLLPNREDSMQVFAPILAFDGVLFFSVKLLPDPDQTPKYATLII